MWRDTGRSVKVWVLDARSCFPVLIFVIYWSWTTFFIALFSVVFFSVISWFGLSVPATFRLMRRLLVGPLRPAVPTWKRRRLA